jgi:type IV secretory pathway TrbL component
LTARTDVSAEAAEVAAAEAAFAEDAAAAEAAAAAGAATRAAADALGARAALAPGLPKETGGGAGGIAEGDEEIPGRPVFCVGGQEELKNANTTFNLITGAHLHGKRYTRIVQFTNPHQHIATFRDRQIHF